MVLSLLRERCSKECLDLLFVQSLYPGVSIRHQFFKMMLTLLPVATELVGSRPAYKGYFPL